MSDNILVSVIIPCYNKEKTIKKTIDSVLKQTVIEYLEIICIDDGSTDNTLKILLDYKKKCKASGICSFRVLQNVKNSSVFSSRAIGFNNATGLYIGAVDPDDWIESTYFEDFLIGAVKENSYHEITLSVDGEEQPEPKLPIPDKNEPLLIEQLYGKDFPEYFYKNKEDLYDIVYTYNILKWYNSDKIFRGKNSYWSNVKYGAYDVDINNGSFKRIIMDNWNTMWNKIIKADIVHKFYFPNLYINLFEDIVFTWMIFPECKNISVIYSRSPYFYNLSDEVKHLTDDSDGSPKHNEYTATGFLLVSEYLYENDLYDWITAWKQYRKGYLDHYGTLFSRIFNTGNTIITVPQKNKDYVCKELFSYKYNIASNKSLTKRDLLPEFLRFRKMSEYFTMCDNNIKYQYSY